MAGGCRPKRSLSSRKVHIENVQRLPAPPPPDSYTDRTICYDQASGKADAYYDTLTFDPANNEVLKVPFGSPTGILYNAAGLETRTRAFDACLALCRRRCWGGLGLLATTVPCAATLGMRKGIEQ